jgi:hypothetical protein
VTAGSLSDLELRAVARLAGAGVSRPVATLAVVLCTREHARPEGELVDVIRQYQHLDDAKAAVSAMGEARGRGWLDTTESYGQTLAHAARDLKQQLATIVQDPAFEQDLAAARAVANEGLRIVGPMSDHEVYGSYLELLREAQAQIRLPMLATTPALSSIPILQDRARHRVGVRILLGHPDVVARYRGDAMRQTAADAIAGWTEHAARLQKMQVRVCHHAEDLVIASCMGIDDRVLRFDVYDPDRQRSLEGVMLEVRSSDGLTPNLHRVFTRAFDEAWQRAQPIGALRTALWQLGRAWPWAAAVPMIVVCAIEQGAGAVGNISGSLAAGFIATGLIDHRPRWLHVPRRA